MADIVLVNPRIGIYNKVFKPFMPLALLAVATFPRQEGFRVRIIDQHMDPDWESTLAAALRERPLCVGITSMTGTQLRWALRAAALVKAHGSTPVVWGGVHGTLFPRETIAHPHIDVIVKREGELIFRDLVRALADGRPLDSVPGLVFKTGGTVRETEDPPFLDLDPLPLLPYDLLDVRSYLHTYFYEPDVIEIETSRGCPFDCGFCYNKRFNAQRWRAKSPERVVENMEHLAETYGITNILAIDDSFFVSIRRVRGIVERIRNSRFDFRFGFQGRLQGVLEMSDSDLERMVEAGCRFLQFGVESGSPRILKMINKRISVADVLEVNARLARYPQIAPFYNFIVGFPTETREDVMQTVALAWRLLEQNPAACIGTIHIYKEYPGTPLYDAAIADGYRPPSTLEEWSEYDWQSAVSRDKSAELMKLLKRVTVSSYCVDHKIEMLGDSKLAALVSRLYRPIARARFKYRYFGCMPEAALF
jgi:radical SAM superfamily enzyme YgiQ (UPF0313 family)